MKELKTFRIDKEVLDRIRAKAEEEHRTLSNMVLTILKEWSDSDKEKTA